MSDDNTTAADPETPAKQRGRPKGATAKPPRVRRNHAAELTALEQRVQTAIKLLRRATAVENVACPESQVTNANLVEVALEFLEGQP